MNGPWNVENAKRVAAAIAERGYSAVAVAFLHSYANPAHEQRTAEILRAAYPHVWVSVSSDITREYREYERTSTVTMTQDLSDFGADVGLAAPPAELVLGHPDEQPAR